MNDSAAQTPYTFLDVSKHIIESFLELIQEALKSDLDSDKIIFLTEALAKQAELFLSAQKNCRDFNDCERHNTFANLEKNIPDLTPFVRETIRRHEPDHAMENIREWLDLHIYSNSYGCPNCDRHTL